MPITLQSTSSVNGENYAASLLSVKKLEEYDTDTEVRRTWEWIRGMSKKAATSTDESGSQPQNIPSRDDT